MTVGKSISGNLIPNAQERVEKWSREARYGFELFCDVWRKIAIISKCVMNSRMKSTHELSLFHSMALL